MIDFKKFAERAIKIIRKKTPYASIAVDCAFWDHKDGTQSIEFKIWDGTTHFTGRTPEQAIRTLQMYYSKATTKLVDLQEVNVPVLTESEMQ
jgi:hypothetical protein